MDFTKKDFLENSLITKSWAKHTFIMRLNFYLLLHNKHIRCYI